MRGRARLIARAFALRGEQVNGYQWNPTAGLSRPGDASVPRGKSKNRKRKRKAAGIPAGLNLGKVKAFACPECNRRFGSEAAREQHRHFVHGTAALVVGDMTRCQVCGTLVKNVRMEKHRRKAHGIMGSG